MRCSPHDPPLHPAERDGEEDGARGQQDQDVPRERPIDPPEDERPRGLDRRGEREEARRGRDDGREPIEREEDPREEEHGRDEELEVVGEVLPDGEVAVEVVLLRDDAEAGAEKEIPSTAAIGPKRFTRLWTSMIIAENFG